MTATVTSINTRLKPMSDLFQGYAPGDAFEPVRPARAQYEVTHLHFDVEDGWSIELKRAGQSSTTATQPALRDLPRDVRAALLEFLGVNPELAAGLAAA
ncbi:hypothetical protein [Rhodococcoides fascians]|uniref:hypothetical protein n=1 Tax=Rhodococcoides fascians TaxID=1828 RepID=UPI00050CF854|nr:hypothetical protein [Rhodococcus fascians]